MHMLIVVKAKIWLECVIKWCLEASESLISELDRHFTSESDVQMIAKMTI